MLERIPLNFYALAGLLNFITSFALTIFVFFRNPKARTNQIFSLFAFTVAGWSLCYFLWLNAEKSYLAEFYLRTLMLFVIFIPSTFTHFILTFLKLDYDKRINLGNYLISFLLAFTVYTRLFARDIGPFLVFPYWLKPRFLFGIHSIHFFANVIYSHFLMLRTIKHHSGAFRNQVLYVLIGTGIGFISGAINYLTWYRVPIPPFLNPLVSIYVASISYAVVKYNLLGIEIASKYLVARTLSLTSVGIVVLLGILPFQDIIAGHNLTPLNIALFMIMGFVALAPLIRRLDQVYGKHLGVRPDYQPALERYTDTGLTTAHNAKQLSDSMVKTLTDTLRIESCSLMLLDREREQYYITSSSGIDGKASKIKLGETSPLISFLKRDSPEIAIKDELDKILPVKEADLVIRDLETLRADISLPLFMRDGLMGVLNLGSKVSGEVYTPEELTFILTVGKESAIIIGLFGEIEGFQAKLIQAEKLAGMSNLLGGFNHEVCNLLAGIKIFIQLSDELKTKEDRDLLRANTERDIARITELFDAVQNYRQTSESKGSKLRDIKEGIEEALSLIRDDLAPANIKLSCNIPSHIPQLETYESFPQLFLNLLKNSYYALEQKGGGELEIKAAKIEDKLMPLEVVISDSAWDLSEVIKKDSLASGGKDVPERSGVGGINFFLAKLIASDHKATLKVTGNEQGGTTFIVRLPLTQPRVETLSRGQAEEGKTR